MMKDLLPPITEADIQRHDFLTHKGHLDSAEMKEYQMLEQKKSESILTAEERAAYYSLCHTENLSDSQKRELRSICTKAYIPVSKKFSLQEKSTPSLSPVAKKAATKYFVLYIIFYIVFYALIIIFVPDKTSAFSGLNFLVHILFIALVSRWNDVMSAQSPQKPKYLLIKQLISFASVYWITKFALSFIVATFFVTSQNLTLNLTIAVIADIIALSIPALLGAWIPWRI